MRGNFNRDRGLLSADAQEFSSAAYSKRGQRMHTEACDAQFQLDFNRDRGLLTADAQEFSSAAYSNRGNRGHSKASDEFFCPTRTSQ